MQTSGDSANEEQDAQALLAQGYECSKQGKYNEAVELLGRAADMASSTFARGWGDDMMAAHDMSTALKLLPREEIEMALNPESRQIVNQSGLLQFAGAVEPGSSEGALLRGDDSCSVDEFAMQAHLSEQFPLHSADDVYVEAQEPFGLTFRGSNEQLSPATSKSGAGVSAHAASPTPQRFFETLMTSANSATVASSPRSTSTPTTGRTPARIVTTVSPAQVFSPAQVASSQRRSSCINASGAFLPPVSPSSAPIHEISFRPPPVTLPPDWAPSFGFQHDDATIMRDDAAPSFASGDSDGQSGNRRRGSQRSRSARHSDGFSQLGGPGLETEDGDVLIDNELCDDYVLVNDEQCYENHGGLSERTSSFPSNDAYAADEQPSVEPRLPYSDPAELEAATAAAAAAAAAAAVGTSSAAAANKKRKKSASATDTLTSTTKSSGKKRALTSRTNLPLVSPTDKGGKMLRRFGPPTTDFSDIPPHPTESLRKKGRWDDDERRLFREGLELHGRNWTKIEEHMKFTRSVRNVKSHAQQYFKHLEQQKKPLPQKVRESGEAYSLSGRANAKKSSKMR